MPYALAAYLWYLLEILQVVGSIAIVRRLMPSSHLSWKIVVATVLCAAQYYVMALHYGNAHLLVIFLLFAAFYFVLKERNLAAAVAMSLAITIKLTPALLLPYFALKGKTRFLLLTGALLIALNLGPAAWFGFNKNVELLKTWYGHVIAEQEFHETNGPINLSLKGQLRRHLTPVDYSQRVDGDIQYPAINIAFLSPSQTDAAWLIFAALAFASALAVIWRTSPARSGATGEGKAEGKEVADGLERAGLEFGLMICVGLFIGPLTSKIYFIALLLPVGCLAAFASRSSTPAARFAVRAILVIAAVNCVLPLLPGRSVQRLLLVLGTDFYVNCLLLAALTRVLIANRQKAPQRSVGSRTLNPSATRTP